jgi:predicted nucleic acid-binding Zn ribbon protein
MLEQARARARRNAPKIAARKERKARGAGEPTSFGAAIQAFLTVRGWDEDANVHAVLSRWPKIAGPEIADHCVPVSLRGGELVLQAESTAWATQLTLLARQIKDRVNADRGSVVVKAVRVHGPTSSRPAAGGWRVRGGRGERDTYG